MKVLITGGNGFLGQHLQQELKNREYDIDLFKNLYGGLLNEEETNKQINESNPNVVIHLAAKVGGIGANKKSPGEFFYKNMKMGLNLIEACRRYKVPKTIVIGTVCSYPKFTPVPFKESDIWNGFPEETNAPYGIAKKALLTMLQAYREQYMMNGIYLIPVNLYGPGDNFNPDSSHVIPALIKKFVEAKDSVTVWGSGSASREFLYVKDAVRGIADSITKYNDPEPINLGNGKEYTIKELVEIIKDLTGFNGKIIWDSTKPDGQPRRCLDVSKAKEELDFEAKVSFEEGLKNTYDWYMSPLEEIK